MPPGSARAAPLAGAVTTTDNGNGGGGGGDGQALKEVTLRTAPQDARFPTSNQASPRLHQQQKALPKAAPGLRCRAAGVLPRLWLAPLLGRKLPRRRLPCRRLAAATWLTTR